MGEFVANTLNIEQSVIAVIIVGVGTSLPELSISVAAVMKNIRQNLFFAFAYNALGIPIAAGLLYPVFGLLLSPMIAAATMSFSSVSVIGNALHLRNFGIEL